MPDPASVTPSASSTPVTVSGTKDSNSTLRQPVWRLVTSQVIPPMWGNGKARAFTSASETSRRSAMPRATAATVASVCWAPLGSAVVPEV